MILEPKQFIDKLNYGKGMSCEARINLKTAINIAISNINMLAKYASYDLKLYCQNNGYGNINITAVKENIAKDDDENFYVPIYQLLKAIAD